MRSENSTIFSGLNATLLWTNPNPSNKFGAQRVKLNESFDNFDYICVEYKREASSSIPIIHTFIAIDENEIFQDSLSGAMTILFRDDQRAHKVFKLTYSSKLEIAFFNGFYADGSQTDMCIPLKVFGVKGKIQGIN